ncbi:MAG: hypothetical protein ACREFP_08790 [Acetobacteraceae bacterium]
MVDEPPVDNATAASRAPEALGERDLPVSLHPMVTTTAVAGIAWSILVLWVVFLIRASLDELVFLTAVTIIGGIPVGCVVGFSWQRYARGVDAQERGFNRRPRDFRDFLNSEMEIATGRIKGKDAYWFAVAICVACAIFGTGIGISLGLA